MAPRLGWCVNVEAALFNVQAFVFRRRLRVKDFFADFDTLRCGRITRDQFLRGLDNLSTPNLSTDEAEAIAEHFTDDGAQVRPPRDVNYRKFCDWVETIFTTPGLESQPEIDVPRPGAGVPAPFERQPVRDQEALDEVLHRVAVLSETRGVDVRQCFEDLPRTRTTESQFRRAFPFTRELGRHDVDKLIERYGTGTGYVNYQALAQDVFQIQEYVAPPFPNVSGGLPEGDTWEHHSIGVVKKLQAICVERRLRVREPFVDFDPLRKGVCTVGQLKTALTVLNIRIKSEDFRELVETFADEYGKFRYVDFCEEIDAAFTTKGLERTPTASVAFPGADTTGPGRRSRLPLDVQELAQLEELKNSIRHRIKGRRFDLRAAFMDFDRTRMGTVRKAEFARVLDQLGFGFAPHQVKVLCKAYCDRGNMMDVNYMLLAQHCDPRTETEVKAHAQLIAPYAGKPKASKYFTRKGEIVPLQSVENQAFPLGGSSMKRAFSAPRVGGSRTPWA